jgi:hypothetical protein
MAYGFQCKNTGGQIQVDSTGLAYGLLTSGTVTTITTGVTQLGTWADYGARPIIMVKLPNTSSYLVSQYISSNTGASIRVFTGSSTASVAMSVQYRVYVPVKGLPNLTNWGIRIFDSNNAKIFNSDYLIPKYTGLLSMPPPTVSTSSSFAQTFGTVALPAGTQSNPWFSIPANGATGTGFLQASVGSPGSSYISTWGIGINSSGSCILGLTPLSASATPNVNASVFPNVGGQSVFIAND